MKEDVDYAVEQMKKEGFTICPITTRRVFRHIIDFIANELNEKRSVEITGLGTFIKEVKEPKKMFCHFTGKEVVTRPRTSIKFKVAKRFKPKILEPKNEDQ